MRAISRKVVSLGELKSYKFHLMSKHSNLWFLPVYSPMSTGSTQLRDLKNGQVKCDRSVDSNS